MNKAAMCNALRAFISQRSGIDFRNYQTGDWKASREAFMGDYKPILKRGRQARELLKAVELRDSITAEMLLEASRAFSGRLQFKEREDGKVGIEYTTGQYFPTEYRSAACAVLSQCLWDYWRNGKGFCGTEGADDIRKTARRELGLGIARDWFR